MKNCVRCQNSVVGKYCTECGLELKLQRISVSYVFAEIGSVLNFEKGILLTIKELLLRPGKNVKAFLHEDRNRLVKPISFTIVCSLVYIIAQRTLGFKDGYIDYSGMGWENPGVDWIMKWIAANYGLANIAISIFIAGWVRIMFKRFGYNYFENLVLVLFLLGIQMLMFSIFGAIESVVKLPVIDTASSLTIVYFCWAVAQFFEPKKVAPYAKALFAYLFGLISFILSAIGLGFLLSFIVF